MKREIQSILSKIRKNAISASDIPDEYANDEAIVSLERKLGLRTITECGYDVVIDKFFVLENVVINNSEKHYYSYYEKFEDYSKYINGKIYENACYYKLDPKRVPQDVDSSLFFQRKAFVQSTIDDYTLQPSEKEYEQYAYSENIKKECKKWIEKINACNNYADFKKMLQNYKRSKIRKDVKVEFFIWNYFFKDISDMSRFETMMKYVSENPCAYSIRDALCAFYDIETVLDKYVCSCSKRTYNDIRKKMRRKSELFKNNKITFKKISFFDTNTHFFCLVTLGFETPSYQTFIFYNYFETIDELVKCLDGDLSNCDFSKALTLDYDFSNCAINDTTLLPITYSNNYTYHIRKYYKHNAFNVIQEWKNESGKTVKEYKHRFQLFCDFVAFLKGDLSNSELMLCDGLNNISDFEGIILTNSEVQSPVLLAAGLESRPYELNHLALSTFESAANNEKETALVLQSNREIEHNWGSHKICYISDLHLDHMVANHKCDTEAKVNDLLFRVARSFDEEISNSDFLLIDGDISSSFFLYEAFICALKKVQSKPIITIVTLGNHEFWEFSGLSVSEIKNKYHTVLAQNGIYLLHNGIIYLDENSAVKTIDTDELSNISVSELQKRLRTSSIVFFGGVGFSGYNDYFNADYGLYRNTIDREKERQETKTFDKLYVKICDALCGANVVIMTHMPLKDWHKPKNSPTVDNGNHVPAEMYQKGFVYVSGHTHRNSFNDDGELRFYADNQFGYNNRTPAAWPHLKLFEIKRSTDYFRLYSDGIHKITAEDYRNFNRLKNIYCEFNRYVDFIYMLKKAGYYCFILQQNGDKLYILNGGSIKLLMRKDIEYYYDNMDAVIAQLMDPLIAYTNYQKKIAAEVKRIGGEGYIHGCIIDIDYFNHIYVNPFDNTITGYWASDIINKIVYPSISDLLKERRPKLYVKYNKLLCDKAKSKKYELVIKNTDSGIKTPTTYYSTDIYSASRQIRKFQRLHSNILSVWPDNPAKGSLLIK